MIIELLKIDKNTKKFIKMYRHIMVNNSILGKLKQDTINNTTNDGFTKNKGLSKKYAGLLIQHYKHCYKEGNKTKQKYFRFLYFTFANSYLGAYDTNYYREFHNPINFIKDKKTLKSELNIYRLIRENIPNKNDRNILAKKGIILFDDYWIDTKYNYAHLLYYVGRFIPSIHICNNLLLKLNQHLKLFNDQKILYICVIYNLLIYLTLTYLYDVKRINNKYTVYKLIVYCKEFLSYYNNLRFNYKKTMSSHIEALKFQARSVTKFMYKLRKNVDKIKVGNKTTLLKKLFNRIKFSYKRRNSPYNSLKFRRWINKRNFGINLSGEFGNKCNESLELPHITHDYVQNLEHEYTFALLKYFISVRYYNYSYLYSMDLMKSALVALYSVLDKITSDISMWVNKYSGKPLIHMIVQYNNKDHQIDYSKDYFHTFFSKKHITKIFKSYGDNDPFQGLYWISKSMDENNNFCDKDLVYCTKLRNAQMHRFIFIKKNNKVGNVKFIKDEYNYNNGAAILNFGEFKILLNHLIYTCRESIILLICFININGKHTSEYVESELKKFRDD